MILDLVDCNDPILKEEIELFDFATADVDPIELAANLADTMLEHNGLGLAANQVGLRYRVFVMKASPLPIVCYNPRIVDTSTETVLLEEGCLSYPNLWVKVKRPKKIKVRYAEPNGNIVTQVFDGMTARVFQHELDHLDGIVHTKRANKFHLEQARKNAKRINKYPRPTNLSPEAKELLDWLKA